MDRLSFWRLFDAMSLAVSPGHDCLAEGHGSLECPHVESVQSLRDAAGDLLTVLQGVQS